METEEIIALVVALIMPISAALSATFKDSTLGKLAGIINLCAGNVGQAKNDRDQS